MGTRLGFKITGAIDSKSSTTNCMRPVYCWMLDQVYLTRRGATVLCVRPPLTPVIGSVWDPVGVLGFVVSGSLDEPVAGFGLKLPLAPLGSPLTLKVTWPLKPPVGLTVTL